MVVAAAREEDFSRMGAATFWDECGLNGCYPCNPLGRQMEARRVETYNNRVHGTLWLWRRLARRTFRGEARRHFGTIAASMVANFVTLDRLWADSRFHLFGEPPACIVNAARVRPSSG